MNSPIQKIGSPKIAHKFWAERFQESYNIANAAQEGVTSEVVEF